MFYTTRQEALDEPKASKRGPIFDVNEAFKCPLRTGFTLQFASTLLLIIVYKLYRGDGLFSFDLHGLSDDYRGYQPLLLAITVLYSIYLYGSLNLMMFQVVAADDTCWARGYRTASKLMKAATFLDVCSSVFQLVLFIYWLKFYTPMNYAHYLSGGSEYLFYFLTRFCCALALLFYGIALLLYEVYHDEGAGDIHGYINFVLYTTASGFCFLSVFARTDSLAIISLLSAVCGASLWSYFFEPEVNYLSPALHETELTNEVEEQVDNFTRHTQDVAMNELNYSNQ